MPRAVRSPFRLSRRPSPLARAVVIALASPASMAQSLPTPPTEASPAAVTAPRPAGALPQPSLRPKGTERDLPIQFEADRMDGTPGERTHASGSVKLRRGDLRMQAEDLVHTTIDNRVEAEGDVVITRRGDRFTGPRAELLLDTLVGQFDSPAYHFGRLEAGGQASRIEFLGNNQLRAVEATYSSCTPDNTGELAWVLQTSQVDLDFNESVGVARNAVVRFMGVPILAAPVLSFPLNDDRKSGLLPPNIYIDNKSGFEFAQPYYWNIAPDRDATITPVISTRRGVSLNSEFRYLRPSDSGEVKFNITPEDQVANRERRLVDVQHRGNVLLAGSPNLTQYDLRWRRVSDDDYWKDFPREMPSLTPRLMESHLNVEQQINLREFGLGATQTQLYGRVQSWQTLQDLDPGSPIESRIISPYRREPQVGLRSRAQNADGLVLRMEAEFNRFSNEDRTLVSGNRVHAVARAERMWGTPSSYVTPAVSMNVASYDLDRKAGSQGPGSLNRTIPTVSVDSGAVFERPVNWFGGDYMSTLEPRLQYVYTPFHAQSSLPRFDSVIRDYNAYTIFNENAFSGIDRVSDANLVNVGMTSRLISQSSGAETLRVGVVQKVLFRDQRITANDGPPDTRRLSDTLMLASTSVIPDWFLDGNAVYQSRDGQIQSGALSARYSPRSFSTVAATYRYNRASNQQVDVGWQWPLFGARPSRMAAQDVAALQARSPGSPAPSECGGGWFSVGRLNYSVRENRVADALLGVEYDGGCWISRVVAQRVSTGLAQSSLRLMMQLELVGLSRLGSSPVRTLQEGVPGYRMLREESSLIQPTRLTSQDTLTDPQDD